MAGQVRAERSGARVVELFMPFQFNGVQVDAVALGPITMNHTLRYNNAEYPTWFAFLVAVAYVNNKPVSDELLRELRYPDADRVIQNFIEILPPEIRESVIAGVWPTREPATPIDANSLMEEFRKNPDVEQASEDKEILEGVDPLNVDS